MIIIGKIIVASPITVTDFRSGFTLPQLIASSRVGPARASGLGSVHSDLNDRVDALANGVCKESKMLGVLPN